MKERFIHFDLVIWKDTRETERNESLFETRAELPDPCRLLNERILPLTSLKKYFFELKIRWVRVWWPPMAILYLNRVTRVFLTHGTRV